ncbi:MAG: response regulator [Elusimicrobiota bacterium]
MTEGIEVLIADDSSSDVELTIRSLRKAKLANRIHVVEDGAQALDFLFCRGIFADRSFKDPPRVVLLDLKMPKVDGIQVLRAVRGDPRTKLIPIVVLTSSKEQRDVVESYDLGVNAYIQKPVEFERFREVVEHIGMFWLVVNEPPPKECFGRETS